MDASRRSDRARARVEAQPYTTTAHDDRPKQRIHGLQLAPGVALRRYLRLDGLPDIRVHPRNRDLLAVDHGRLHMVKEETGSKTTGRSMRRNLPARFALWMAGRARRRNSAGRHANDWREISTLSPCTRARTCTGG